MPFNKDAPLTEEDSKLSKFNSAGLINVHLENLFQSAYINFRKNRLWSFNQDLTSIWMILGGDEQEGSDWVKRYNDIEFRLGATGCLYFQKKGFNEPNEKFIKNQSYQKQLLIDKAIFLRRLQNKQGKGTAYKENEDDWE